MSACRPSSRTSAVRSGAACPRGRRPTTRQPVERRAGQSRQDPLPAELRAELLIEPDGGRVPVENRPFHPPAAAPLRDPRQLAEERVARAPSALLGEHEQVPQVETRAPEEGRVREEVEREA